MKMTLKTIYDTNIIGTPGHIALMFGTHTVRSIAKEGDDAYFVQTRPGLSSKQSIVYSGSIELDVYIDPGNARALVQAVEKLENNRVEVFLGIDTHEDFVEFVTEHFSRDGDYGVVIVEDALADWDAQLKGLDDEVWEDVDTDHIRGYFNDLKTDCLNAQAKGIRLIQYVCDDDDDWDDEPFSDTDTFSGPTSGTFSNN